MSGPAERRRASALFEVGEVTRRSWLSHRPGESIGQFAEQSSCLFLLDHHAAQVIGGRGPSSFALHRKVTSEEIEHPSQFDMEFSTYCFVFSHRPHR
jgi:hypothetical protein